MLEAKNSLRTLSCNIRYILPYIKAMYWFKDHLRLFDIRYRIHKRQFESSYFAHDISATNAPQILRDALVVLSRPKKHYNT